MNDSIQNPASNQLGAGLTDAQVLGAVQKSGYPLQTIVGDTLRSDFFVQEEWSYIDRDTKELRTIDIRAKRMLYDLKEHPRVRPQLDLVIECKQSHLPCVFFLSRNTPNLLNFPEIAGLHKDILEITTDDDLSTWSYHVSHALDLNLESFHKAPRYCNSFSKCVRKGAEIELSGTEAYTGLVLPLIKGVQHLIASEQPVETAWYFDAHLVLSVAVLDSPMIAASIGEGKTILTFLPWVRVLRHEYLEEADWWQRDRMWAVDVVHKDFLAIYLAQHVLPFAERFSQRVLRHPSELATGEGFALGMGKDSWGSIEGRLVPRPRTARVNRAKLILKNLTRLLTDRGPER
jgi:hypothetical protein